jgi:hypothetical protein
MNWMKPLKYNSTHPDKLEGGLEDMGNFKEGFCFRLNSQTNGKIFTFINIAVWNICADSYREK